MPRKLGPPHSIKYSQYKNMDCLELSQKMATFITATVRTSNPKYKHNLSTKAKSEDMRTAINQNDIHEAIKSQKEA
jgi:hypothetical protein